MMSKQLKLWEIAQGSSMRFCHVNWRPMTTESTLSKITLAILEEISARFGSVCDVRFGDSDLWEEIVQVCTEIAEREHWMRPISFTKSDHPKSIARYYEDCSRRSKAWLDRLDEAKSANAPAAVIKALDDEALRAGYTGD